MRVDPETMEECSRANPATARSAFYAAVPSHCAKLARINSVSEMRSSAASSSSWDGPSSSPVERLDRYARRESIGSAEPMRALAGRSVRVRMEDVDPRAIA
jgi:hypothetical protein